MHGWIFSVPSAKPTAGTKPLGIQHRSHSHKHLLLEEFKKDGHRTEENFNAQCFAGKSSAAPTRGTVNASRLRSYLNSIKKRKCGKEVDEVLHLMQCSLNVGL